MDICNNLVESPLDPPSLFVVLRIVFARNRIKAHTRKTNKLYVNSLPHNTPDTRGPFRSPNVFITSTLAKPQTIAPNSLRERNHAVDAVYVGKAYHVMPKLKIKLRTVRGITPMKTKTEATTSPSKL